MLTVVGMGLTASGDLNGLVLACSGILLVGAALRLHLVVVAGSTGLIVLHRRWFRWVPLHVPWENVAVQRARLRLFRGLFPPHAGLVAVPPGTKEVWGRGLSGLATITSDDGRQVVLRIRNRERLLKEISRRLDR